MTMPRIYKSVLISLTVIVVAYVHDTEGSIRLDPAIKSTQSEIQNAQRAFTLIQNSSGKNTQQFDAALKRLRSQIDVLNTSIKRAGQNSSVSDKNLSQILNRLNTYLGSLEKARAQSDWRAVESDLRQLDLSAKNLSSATREVLATSENLALTRPQPSTTNQVDIPPIATTPSRQKSASKPYATAPYKRPIQVVPQTTAPPTAARPAQPPDSVQQKTQAARATSKEKPDSPGYSRKPRTSLKTQNFLLELRSARSMAEVRKAYERGHFTDAELGELQQQVEKSTYSKKLKQLVKLEEMTEPEKRKRNVVTKAETDAVIFAKRHELERRQQQELKRLNEQAETTLRHLRSKTGDQLRAGSNTGKVYEITNSDAAANSRAIDMDSRHESLPPIEDLGEILTIEGTIPWQGMGWFADLGDASSIIITGNHFADDTGEVDFLPDSLRDQRRVIPLSVHSWSDHRIVAEFPRREVELLLGYARHYGAIRVKRSGNVSGPRREFTLYTRPPPPRITNISTHEGEVGGSFITPGQTILILGEHLAPVYDGARQSTPRVILQHTGGTGSRINTALEVNEFDDTWISAHLGSIEGVPESAGSLKVIGPFDQESSMIPITFQPTLSTWVFEERLEHHCVGFFGFKDTETLHDHSLANEWKVVNHGVRNGGYGGRGCNWLESPAEGSTETATRVEYWCDLFSTIFCTSEVTIEGPAGIHWQ